MFLSVIIPSFSRFRHVVDAIQSVLCQDLTSCPITSRDIEVIVIFDGGNYIFANVLQRLFSHTSVRFYFKENGGVGSALNYGISLATGRFINWLSDDDMMTSNHVAEFYRRFQAVEFPQCEFPTIIYGGFSVVDNDGTLLSKGLPQSEWITDPSLREQSIFPLIKSRIHGCSLWIDKCLFTQHGLFTTKLRTTQDYYLWFKLFSHANIFCVHDVVTILSRQHDGQDSNQLASICREEGDELWTYFICSFTSTLTNGRLRPIQYLEVLRKHLKGSLYAGAYCQLLSFARQNLLPLNFIVEIFGDEATCSSDSYMKMLLELIDDSILELHNIRFCFFRKTPFDEDFTYVYWKGNLLPDRDKCHVINTILANSPDMQRCFCIDESRLTNEHIDSLLALGLT